MTTFKPADIKAVRKKLRASQTECALLIGVNPSTLRNWEQGRRVPDGPALALLRVASKNPAAVAEALHGWRGAAQQRLYATAAGEDDCRVEAPTSGRRG